MRNSVWMMGLLLGCGGAASPSTTVNEPVAEAVTPAQPAAEASPAPRPATAPPDCPTGNFRMQLEAPDDVAAPPSDAVVTASGLASKVLKCGRVPLRPSARDTVRVHYVGWTTDGNRFDSSLERGEPTEFPLNAVIRGWTEGMQLMRQGEIRRFWIPEALAYRGQAGMPAGMLVFDVELLDVL